MESGPKDERLTGYHAHPCGQLHRHGEKAVIDIEDDEEISQAEGDDSDGGDEETPKVAAAISFESGEAEDD